MPAGVADAPRAVPFQLLVVEFGFREPEDEILLVVLRKVLFNALADAGEEVFALVLVENVVFVELGGVKIDVALGNIGIAERGSYSDFRE